MDHGDNIPWPLTHSFTTMGAMLTTS
jgi:hypothetical protein